MLALTHHVLVRYASLSVGKVNFEEYCILGDDIVIADEAVSEAYLHLMSKLGVGINRSKSVESFRFTEFAKTLVGHKCNITPLGPGLILRSLRNRFYILRLILEANSINLVPDYKTLDLVSKMPSFLKKGGDTLKLVLGSYILSLQTIKPLVDFQQRYSVIEYGAKDSLYKDVIETIKLLSIHDLCRGRTEALRSIKYLCLKG